MATTTTVAAGASSLTPTTLLKPPLHRFSLFKPTPIPHSKPAKLTNISADGATEKLLRKLTPDGWKSKPALQIPDYPDKDQLESVLKTLESYPPIVFTGVARKLEERLGEAARGDAFLLQGGDCAESFKEFKTGNIRDTFRLLLQMSVVLMLGGQMPVIKVGRMAGQFAKLRSDTFEEKDG